MGVNAKGVNKEAVKICAEGRRRRRKGLPACWQGFILLRNMGHLFLQPLLPWGEMLVGGGV